MPDNRFKIRIRHPSGAEFEAEGQADIVLSQKSLFMEEITRNGESRTAGGGPARSANANSAERTEKAIKDSIIQWQDLAEVREGLCVLSVKGPKLGKNDAALLILAAGRQLKSANECSAIGLVKSLKASGYQPKRLDRLLSLEIREGKILALGSKRNRRYRLSSTGMAAAAYIAMSLNQRK